MPPTTPEFAKFTHAMRQILKVSKDELRRRMDAEKQEKRTTPSASPASVAWPKRVN